MTTSSYREANAAGESGSLLVRVKGIELFAGIDGQKLQQQLTVSATVIVPVSGSGELTDGEGRRSLRPDHVCICPPGGTFGIEAERGGELSVYMVRFDLLQLHAGEHGSYIVDDSPAARLAGLEREIGLQPEGRAASLCRDMMERLDSGDELERLRAQISGSELVHMMLSAGRDAVKLGTSGALQRAKTYMDQQYSEDITIERLAAVAELSPKYFVDLFKKTYGISAFDYLTQVRMNRAKQFMLRTGLRLRDIAHEVGYDDEFYFSRKFKKTFGMPPSAYLKRRSRRIAAYGSVSATGYLLALGIVPYAAPLHPKWSGYYCDRYGADIAVHLDAYRNNLYKRDNLGKLAQACPELIVVNGELEAWERAALESIAPLYELPHDRCGWRSKLLALADRLEEREEAQRWIADFERKVRGRRERLPSAFGSGKVLVVKLLKEQLYVHSCYSFGTLLYEELRLPRAFPNDALKFNHPVTLDELDRIEAERVLLLVCQETETLDYWKKLQRSVRWMSLHAVRDNKLRLVASEPWREYSPIALDRMLEESERLFSGYRP